MRKGMISFEFLIILGMIILATAAITIDALEESKRSMILSTTKLSVVNELGIESFNSSCTSPKIESYQVKNQTLNFNITEGCRIKTTEIADKVEKEICEVDPDHNKLIRCGGDIYEVEIQ